MTWKFTAYVAPSGKCEIADRLDRATGGVLAQFDAALDYLRNRRRDEWTKPRTFAAKLQRNDWPDFYEIRFLADRVQQRPIGFFRPERDEFVIVIWAIEKGNRLEPKSWPTIANNRRVEIIDGLATTKIIDG